MTTALNEVRRARRRSPLPWPHDAAATTPDVDALLDLRKAISGLSRRQQEALILRHLVDLPVDEVATLMRCESGTVKAHLWRARQVLAERMEAEWDA